MSDKERAINLAAEQLDIIREKIDKTAHALFAGDDAEQKLACVTIFHLHDWINEPIIEWPILKKLKMIMGLNL